MKTPVLLIEKSDIHDHVKSLWRTEAFKKSHAGGGFIHGIIDRFARLPRFYAEMSDEYLERAHFNVWWSGFHPRAYEKDVWSDMYLLHELAHGADMVHFSGMHAENFYRKMFDNELWASTISEIVVYFALPELREMTFVEEIFADRFLGDAACRRKWQDDPERLVMELCYRRRQAMFYPAKGDKIENWLHGFTSQNDAWFSVWKNRFDLVEQAMEDLSRLSLAGQRKEALLRHMDWLYSPKIAKGGNIPFPEEAADFAQVYWKNRAASDVQKAV